MTKNITTRLETLRKVLGRDRPTLCITFADGHESITDAAQGIELVRAGAPVVKVRSATGNNGQLPELLEALVRGDDENESPTSC